MNRAQRISLILLFCLVSACGGQAKPATQNSYESLVAIGVAATLTAVPATTIAPTATPAPTLPKSVYEFRYRQFDPASMFYAEKIPYPEELISIQDSDIIPLACSHRYEIKMRGPVFKDQPTPTSEPDITREYIYTDSITKEKEGISDPLLKAFLINANIYAESHGTRPNSFIRVVPE